MYDQTYLGKFKIIECIKKDKFFGVYLADHIYLGKNILLKTLDSSFLEDKTLLDRFNREAKILANLEHPNIIRVMDFGIHDSTFYISFEFFKSRTLREIIQSDSLSYEEKKLIVVQLFQALNYAHKKGIIHRDIKPENVLVDDSLKLKIADFGLALGVTDSNVTNQYSIVGTPSYMSPEQIRGEKLTEQSDLFSAGLTIFELFTGKNPFLGGDVAQTINKIVSGEEINLNNYRELSEDNIKYILHSLLKKDKSKRAKNAEEILSKLNIKSTISTDISFTKSKKKNKYYLIPVVIIIASFGMLLIKEFITDNETKTITNQKQLTSFDTSISAVNINPNLKQNVVSQSRHEMDKLNSKTNNNQSGIKKIESDLLAANTSYGKLMIDCSPWAEIIVDNKKIDTTPLKEAILVTTGKHLISLKHPDYPLYNFFIESKENETAFYKFNIPSLFSFIEIDVFPWGEVYVNNQLIGVTPLGKSIPLLPGEYRLVLKNPNYTDYSINITLERGETKEIKYIFDNQREKIN